MADDHQHKFGGFFPGGFSGGAGKYRAFAWGDVPLSRAVWSEFVTSLVGSLPGALGLFLRRRLYPMILGGCGRGVVFGRGVTLRHPHKIRLGDRVVIDDNVVLDAKGETNAGIRLGDRVFLGRNTILSCKNGDIELGEAVNVSTNCQLTSAKRLEIGAFTVIGSFSYFVSGGGYDYTSPVPFSQQEGSFEMRETIIGANCWFGAHVTVTDRARIGEHCVLGAGAVVNSEIPPGSIAVGIPARVIKAI
jgi:acetyltransferase-like isoleucine patch superfamily enzyme